MRERHALLCGVVTEIEIARQLRRGSKLVMIKHHRKPGERGERFAAHGRREIHTGKIDRSGANRADAIEAQLQIVFAGDSF